MNYIAIPLTDKSAVLEAIYGLFPEGTFDFPLDLDKELENQDMDKTRLRLKAVRNEIDELLFRNPHYLYDSEYRLSEVALETLGIWVKLEKWITGNKKFVGWIVTDIRKFESFGDLTVDDVKVQNGEGNSKVIKFTVGGYGAKGYNVDYHDYFEEVLTSHGELPETLDSSLLGHYPPSIIDLIHKQITQGSLAA